MYGDTGEVCRIRCLEAALFAVQDARYSQLTQPTEFIANIPRRGDRLKIYFGAGDHTVRTRDGKPALGVPAPSTNDVHLFRALATKFGLREVWVTNGMYTGVVAAENLWRFSTRED